MFLGISLSVGACYTVDEIDDDICTEVDAGDVSIFRFKDGKFEELSVENVGGDDEDDWKETWKEVEAQ